MANDTKVLIHLIDDDDRFTHNLSLQLTANGYSVKIYNSPLKFLSTINDKTQGCIILDINMPSMDGLTLQKRLNELEVPIKIIFLSGHADVPKCSEAMKAGAIEFFEKPITIHKLLPAIKRALEIDNHRIHKEQTAGDPHGLYQTLTNREREVFSLIVQGLRSPQIAKKLGVKLSTALMHRKNLFAKLDLHSIAEVINFATKHDLNGNS